MRKLQLDTRDRAASKRSSANARPAEWRRAWRVVHACEHAGDLSLAVEGQILAGMKPYIVTPEGSGWAEAYLEHHPLEHPHTLSLLRAWQDVRGWRKALLESDPEDHADLVHAHSFAAGMAAVRSCQCVVYDFRACIEEQATSLHQCESGSWMARSFRVAEQFILSRASAVVVHSLGMRRAAIERGAAEESVFLIPDPVPLEDFRGFPAPPAFDSQFPERKLVFAAPGVATTAAGELTEPARNLLQAFGRVLERVPETALVLCIAEDARPAREELSALPRSENIRVLPPGQADAVIRSAGVVIALCEPALDPVAARAPSDVCLGALLHGQALIAADLERHREVSPNGAGCVWFDSDDPQDLARRMIFVAENPEFQAALSRAGWRHIRETRSSDVVGGQYDQVYRYASLRRRTTNGGQGIAGLRPLECC